VKNLEDSRKAFLVFFLLGVVIAGISGIDCIINVLPQYQYIRDTETALGKVKSALSLDSKIAHIKEAIEFYQQGPNLVGLKALAELGSGAQIRVFLPVVLASLGNEYSARLFTPSRLKLAFLEAAFIFFAFVGLVGKYESWKTESKHLVIGATLALLFAIFIAVLP